MGTKEVDGGRWGGYLFGSKKSRPYKTAEEENRGLIVFLSGKERQKWGVHL